MLSSTKVGSGSLLHPGFLPVPSSSKRVQQPIYSEAVPAAQPCRISTDDTSGVSGNAYTTTAAQPAHSRHVIPPLWQNQGKKG